MSTPTGPPAPLVDPPSTAETLGLGLAALAAAVVTVAFETSEPITVALLTLSLVPWALLVAGVRMPLGLFVVGTLAPAAAVIAIEKAGAPIFLAIVAVARVFDVTGQRWSRAAAFAAALGITVLYGFTQENGLADAGVPYFAIGTGVGALAGHQTHRQRMLTAELRWTHTRLNAADAAEERRRIAREVHDVVAHSLTVVMLSVSGARKALSSHPELAAEALERAEQVGRESLDGIRRVVGLLREGDEPATSPPTPTAADVRTIVDQQRRAGADVRLDVTGDIDAVEPLAGAALARVVQESLTNAQRHAPGALISVHVRVGADGVGTTVTNGAPARRPLDAKSSRQGLGLLGMRERVEALGGAFTAGPATDGEGWQVAAFVPFAAGGNPSAVPPACPGDRLGAWLRPGASADTR